MKKSSGVLIDPFGIVNALTEYRIRGISTSRMPSPILDAPAEVMTARKSHSMPGGLKRLNCFKFRVPSIELWEPRTPWKLERRDDSTNGLALQAKNAAMSLAHDMSG